MKILLDESLPRKLKYEFESVHIVLSVKEQGWLGKKNGELLRLMSDNGFELFITVDKHLAYQQNLNSYPTTIVILRAKNNRRQTLSPLIPKNFDFLKTENFKKVIEVL